MARILGGITTSHVPAIGRAIARNLQQEPYWRPFFDAFAPVHRWLAETRPEVLVVFYNDHGLNFFLDKKWGYENFVNYNGYQPPFTTIEPDTLIADGVVPESLNRAVVTEEMFTKAYVQGQLSADVDDMWLDAWDQIQAGS